jgi:hypothetical protein
MAKGAVSQVLDETLAARPKELCPAQRLRRLHRQQSTSARRWQGGEVFSGERAEKASQRLIAAAGR